MLMFIPVCVWMIRFYNAFNLQDLYMIRKRFSDCIINREERINSHHQSLLFNHWSSLRSRNAMVIGRLGANRNSKLVSKGVRKLISNVNNNYNRN